MDHATAHRDQQRAHPLHDGGELQRAQAARGEREIDGAPALGLRLARVRAALVEPHLQSTPREQQREQGAGEPGADDVDARAGERAHRVSRSDCVSASAKRQTSSKRLYSGTGATRMTSGERQSQTTPRALSPSNTPRPRALAPAMRSDS